MWRTSQEMCSERSFLPVCMEDRQLRGKERKTSWNLGSRSWGKEEFNPRILLSSLSYLYWVASELGLVILNWLTVTICEMNQCLNIWESQAWGGCPEFLGIRLLSVPKRNTVKGITAYISIYYKGSMHLSVNVDSAIQKCIKFTFAEISGSFFLVQKWLALDFFLCAFTTSSKKSVVFFFQGESLICSNQTGFSGTDSLWNCRAEESSLSVQLYGHRVGHWIWQCWAKQPLAFFWFFVFISRSSIPKCRTFISLWDHWFAAVVPMRWAPWSAVMEIYRVLNIYKCLMLVLFLWTFL